LVDGLNPAHVPL